MEEIMNRSESSVEITRNSKGIIQFSIKEYGADLEKTKLNAIDKFDALVKKYPFG